jgi:hypothetical protein
MHTRACVRTLCVVYVLYYTLAVSISSSAYREAEAECSVLRLPWALVSGVAMVEVYFKEPDWDDTNNQLQSGG